MLAHEYIVELAALATDRVRRAALSRALQLETTERDGALGTLLSSWRVPGNAAPRSIGHPRQRDVLCVGDARYPLMLSATPDPPPILFFAGSCELLSRPCIAIVGSRKALPSSVAQAKIIAGDLSRQGFVVVSGLARGVDGAAHAGALDASGDGAPGGTIAVLGAGLDRVYPPEHAGLFARVAQHGLLLTEHGPGVRPYPSHFPQRNRIISGVACAVVVIEAAAQSGSLGTAREALEQGREVLVVPGPVQGGRFAGSHRLLRDGAALVESADDVLAVLGVAVQEQPSTTAGVPAATMATPHSADAARVLECCTTEGAGTGVETICVRLGLAISTVRELLTWLELDGFVAQSSHGYIRCR